MSAPALVPGQLIEKGSLRNQRALVPGLVHQLQVSINHQITSSLKVPVPVDLGSSVRTAGIECSGLTLRRLLRLARHLRAARLIKLRTDSRLTDSFEDANRA